MRRRKLSLYSVTLRLRTGNPAQELAVTQSFPSRRTCRFPYSSRCIYLVVFCHQLFSNMNGIVRSAFRATALRGVLSSSCGSNSSGQLTRALWNMCSHRQIAEITPLISMPELHDLRAQRCYSTKGIDSLTSVLSVE